MPTNIDQHMLDRTVLLTVKGAFSLLLMTTVLPAMSAGAVFFAKKSLACSVSCLLNPSRHTYDGTFQGIMAATTP
jgi:hypothetical protein